MPELTMYSKLSSSNQSGKLSGVYQQTTSASVFSGYCNVSYTPDFFENLQKKAGTSAEAKSIPAIISSLSSTLRDLRVQREISTQEITQHDTVSWHSMEGLSFVTEGRPVDTILKVKNRFFMGSKSAGI